MAQNSGKNWAGVAHLFQGHVKNKNGTPYISYWRQPYTM